MNATLCASVWSADSRSASSTQMKRILWQLINDICTDITDTDIDLNMFRIFSVGLLFRFCFANSHMTNHAGAVQSAVLEMISKCCVCNLTVSEQRLPARVWRFPAQQLLSYLHTECGRILWRRGFPEYWPSIYIYFPFKKKLQAALWSESALKLVSLKVTFL